MDANALLVLFYNILNQNFHINVNIINSTRNFSLEFTGDKNFIIL